MRVMIDAFAGLGGASEAFIRDSEWKVHRYDNNPLLVKIPGMNITDSMIEDIVDLHQNEEIDLLWMSPPCTEFSRGFNAPLAKRSRMEEGFEFFTPNMSHIVWCEFLIKLLKPKFWVVENVVGSIPFISNYFGEPTQKIGPQVLWGNFPWIQLPANFKSPSKTKCKAWSSDPLRANKRAVIPYEISMCLKIGIEEQRTLTEWI